MCDPSLLPTLARLSNSWRSASAPPACPAATMRSRRAGGATRVCTGEWVKEEEAVGESAASQRHRIKEFTQSSNQPASQSPVLRRARARARRIQSTNQPAIQSPVLRRARGHARARRVQSTNQPTSQSPVLRRARGHAHAKSSQPTNPASIQSIARPHTKARTPHFRGRLLLRAGDRSLPP